MAPPPRQRIETPERLNSTGLSCYWLGAAADGGRFMLVGELDLVTADCARGAIRRAQDKTTALICDLGDVWFVDLSGLRVLLEATARARRTGARLTIANCPPILPRMLALLELEDALDIQAAPPAPHPRWGRPRSRPAPRGLD